MLVQFVDLDDQTARPKRAIATTHELVAMFSQLRSGKTLMFELLAENGYKLGIGLDGDIGCVQFTRVDHEPPYFMAVTDRPTQEGLHAFILSGSATEVQAKHCLPVATVERIASYFQETGERLPSVVWEEV
jgi:Immunity protein Imm1